MEEYKANTYTGVDFADPKDFERIVDLAVELYDNTENPLPPYDLEKVVLTIGYAFSKHPTFVYRIDGVIRGILVLTEDAPWWSKESHLTDLVFYVQKPYRSYEVASSLLKAAIDYAKIEDKRFFSLMVNPDDGERKVKLYKRMGLKPVGYLLGSDD